MFNFLTKAELNNSFELPEIPENMILELDKDYNETLVLKIPVILKTKRKFLYLKPPSFTKYEGFLKDLTKLLITSIIKSEGLEKIKNKPLNDFTIETNFNVLINLIASDAKPLSSILSKYFVCKLKRDACSIKTFLKNANPFQVQRMLVYLLYLDTAVKKNEKFLRQKLDIDTQLQILKEQSEKKSDGKNPLAKPRF